MCCCSVKACAALATDVPTTVIASNALRLFTLTSEVAFLFPILASSSENDLEALACTDDDRTTELDLLLVTRWRWCTLVTEDVEADAIMACVHVDVVF